MAHNRKKQSWLAVHPLHFHLGVYIAIAALLITAVKSSQGMIAVIYGSPDTHSTELINTAHMREAETHVGHAQLSFARPARVSGT